jgi:hypothetical protein
MPRLSNRQLRAVVWWLSLIAVAALLALALVLLTTAASA